MVAMKLGFFIAVSSSCIVISFGASPVYKQACSVESQQPWSYDNELPNGVQRWSQYYPQCNGRKQSPINILTSKVKKYWYLPKLQLYNYNKPVTRSTMTNEGYTVKIVPKDGIQRSIRVNGVIYTLKEIHFHWGQRKNTGSEHKVNYKQYSMEIHFLHSDRRGRNAVVGVFYQESHEDNIGLTPVIDALSQIPYKGDSVNIKDELYLDDIIDNMCSFYRYTGSLTTPGCMENVIWTICRDVHTIGHNQIAAFRKLYSGTYADQDMSNCRISNNYRPTQPLNGRVVVSSA